MPIRCIKSQKLLFQNILEYFPKDSIDNAQYYKEKKKILFIRLKRIWLTYDIWRKKNT